MARRRRTGCDQAILRQVIKDSGLKFKENTRSFIFDCPRCGKKDKLAFIKETGWFACWYCRETENYQGKPEFALADLLGISVRQVRGRLYGDEGGYQAEVYLDVHLEDFYGDDDDEDVDAAPLPLVYWPYDYHEIAAPESTRGAEYLAGRGIPLELATEYGVRYCPLKRRVVFPVSSEGQLYGWQERLVISGKYTDENGSEKEVPKVLSSVGIPRDRSLMFVDRLLGSEHALLAEGPVDAIKAHLCGGNVCAMGKAVTSAQMKLVLRGGVRRCYLALDPDAAEETQRLVRDYFADVELYTMTAKVRGGEEKADLGAMTFTEVKDVFQGARPVTPGQLFVFMRP